MIEPDYIALQPPAFDKTKVQSKRLTDLHPDASLEERCRVVVAMHLERYPPEAIGMLGEDAWNSIVKFKFERTNPIEGKRRTAAINQHFLTAVEAENLHLADSAVADKYVWKDLCELQFPRSGLSRPKGLLYPWSILIQRISKAGQELLDSLKIISNDNNENLASETLRVERSVQILAESAMSVSLLQSSGIGKTVNKIVKHASKLKVQNKSELLFRKRQVPYMKSSKNQPRCEISIMEQLQTLLISWKELASRSGVAIAQDATLSKRDAIKSTSSDDSVHQDLEFCQLNCPTWRALFQTLSSREVQRRTNEGARLRQRREHRAKHQPKVIKVRPTSASAGREKMLNKIKHQPIGTKFAASTNTGKRKLQALRDESKVAANWQKSKSGTIRPASSSFGNAVAFASVGKSAKRLKGAMKHVEVKGGKFMKIPDSKLKKKLSKARY